MDKMGPLPSLSCGAIVVVAPCLFGTRCMLHLPVLVTAYVPYIIDPKFGGTTALTPSAWPRAWGGEATTSILKATGGIARLCVVTNVQTTAGEQLEVGIPGPTRTKVVQLITAWSRPDPPVRGLGLPGDGGGRGKRPREEDDNDRGEVGGGPVPMGKGKGKADVKGRGNGSGARMGLRPRKGKGKAEVEDRGDGYEAERGLGPRERRGWADVKGRRDGSVSKRRLSPRKETAGRECIERVIVWLEGASWRGRLYTRIHSLLRTFGNQQ